MGHNTVCSRATVSVLVLVITFNHIYSQEHIAASAQPTNFNGIEKPEIAKPEIAKPEPVVNKKNDKPVVTPKSSSNTSPNASKPINTAPPVGKSAKPVPRKDPR